MVLRSEGVLYMDSMKLVGSREGSIIIHGCYEVGEAV